MSEVALQKNYEITLVALEAARERQRSSEKNAKATSLALAEFMASPADSGTRTRLATVLRDTVKNISVAGDDVVVAWRLQGRPALRLDLRLMETLADMVWKRASRSLLIS